MSPHYGIADVCPGCETPLVSGAILTAIDSAQQYHRVWGITADVTLDDCDAVYIGDLITGGVLRCRDAAPTVASK
jgi:hypothetical protein